MFGQNWKFEAIASSQVMTLPEWTAARPMMSARFDMAARLASLCGRSLRIASSSTFHSACQALYFSLAAFQTMLSGAIRWSL